MQRLVLICRELYEQPAQSQRDLAKKLSLSLGTINTTMAKALDLGYITKEDYGYPLTQKGLDFLENYRVDAALFLAAGFGSRFVPLTYETPKGLLKVFGERMIERQIQQLHAVGITDITIAVGYLKEKFEYLIDAYGVKLLYNPEYATKNTLATLWNARSAIEGKNVYILSCDNCITPMNRLAGTLPLTWKELPKNGVYRPQRKEEFVIFKLVEVTAMPCMALYILQKSFSPNFCQNLVPTMPAHRQRNTTGSTRF